MYIFLDTETHSKENPILIQLAYSRQALKHEDRDDVVNEYYSTGGPKIEFWAMAVHHITEKKLEDKKTFNDSIDRPMLWAWLSPDTGWYTLVAHNAKFDVWVLENHGVKVPEYICTLKLARHVYPELEAHNLQFLRYALGLEFEEEINPHDALSDIIVLEKLFDKLHYKILENMLIKWEMTDEDILKKKMINITRSPSLLHKCIFGKYAGTLWSEVPREYLEWLVYKSSFDDEDVLYTARYHLSNNSQLKI